MMRSKSSHSEFGTGGKSRVIYKDVRDEIENGDILMYKGRGLMAGLIKRLTHSQYSHAGIAVWWNERLMVMEAVQKGVVISPLSRNLRKYKGNVQWFVCNEPITAARRRDMIVYAQEELGKEYSTWGVILLGIKIFLKLSLKEKDKNDSDRKLFCSQYVSKIYNSINIDLSINTGNGTTSPDDIVKSDKTRFKGILK